jgi:hypothetical protein
MAELSAHAALLRTQDVRRAILVAGANHDTLMVDPYAREVARASALCQCAVQPQSIVSVLPVMARASSEQR